MLKRLLFASILLMSCAVVQAAPPYDVVVNVSAPATGGPVDAYECYLDGNSLGVCSLGANSFPGLLTADQDYTFTVGAQNALGETLSDPVVVNPGNLPGKPSISVSITVTLP